MIESLQDTFCAQYLVEPGIRLEVNLLEKKSLWNEVVAFSLPNDSKARRNISIGFINPQI